MSYYTALCKLQLFKSFERQKHVSCANTCFKLEIPTFLKYLFRADALKQQRRAFINEECPTWQQPASELGTVHIQKIVFYSKGTTHKMHKGLGAAPAINKNMDKHWLLNFQISPKRTKLITNLSWACLRRAVWAFNVYATHSQSHSLHSSKLPERHWNDGKTSMMQVWLCNPAPVHVSAANTWTNRASGEFKMMNMSGKNLKNNMKCVMEWFRHSYLASLLVVSWSSPS